MERNLTMDRAGTPTVGPIATREVRAGGGTTLHACEWGNRHGPSILLIHGWSQSQMCWAHQIQSHLADDFHIVTFDIRGHGMSEKPTQIDLYANAQLWADDVAAVIEQHRLERPVLVGWSYGGFIISDYLRAYGEQAIAGVNLVGGAVMLKPPTFDHLGMGLLANAEDACSSDLTTSIPAVLRFLSACTARPLTPDDWNSAVSWNMIVPAEVRSALISRQIDGDDVLSSLTIPVLVTHGRSDDIVLPSMAEHVAAVCNTAQLSWYDETGHMPFLENEVRFNRELADFAARVNPPNRPTR